MRVQNIQSSLLRADSLATSAFLIGGLEPPSPAGGVRRGRRPGDPARRRGGRGPAGRPRRPGGAEPGGDDVRHDDHPGPRQQPAGLPGRLGLPPQRQRGPAHRRPGDRRGAGRGQCGARRGRDGRPSGPTSCSCPGCSRSGCCSRSTDAWPRSSGAATTWGCSPRSSGVAAATLVGVVVSAGQRGANADLSEGDYRSAVDEATARSAGNDARSNEALRLINRGSGAGFEAAYADAADVVREDASGPTLDLWTAYDTLHTQVIELDDGGQWDGAVAVVTGPDVDVGLRRLRHRRPGGRRRQGRRHHHRAALGQRSQPRARRRLAAGRARRRGPVHLGHRRPTTGVRMRNRIAALGLAAALVAGQGLLAACGYDATPVPGDRGRPVHLRRADRPRRPDAGGARLHQRRDGRALLRPPGSPAGARPDAGRLDDARHPGPGLPDRRRRRRQLPAVVAQPVHGHHRGLRRGHGQPGRPGHLRRRLPPAPPAARDHAGRPDPAAPGRRGRHRGAQHDDQLLALAADRLLGRVLPLRPEAARRPRRRDHVDRGPLGQAGVRPRRHDQHREHPSRSPPTRSP